MRCGLCLAGGDFRDALTVINGWAVCAEHFEELGQAYAGQAVADAAEDMLRGEG